MSELINYESKSVHEIKRDLKALKITTKDQAINILNFLSALKSAEKHLKEEAKKKLDSCVDCEYYEASNGNQVQKIEVEKKIVIEDEYMKKLLGRKKDIEKQIKDYEEELKKDEKNYEVKKSHYYKSI